MTTLIKSHFEKILLILAGAALLVSMGWCWRREGVAPLRASAVHHTNADYKPAALTADPTNAEWSPPVAQRAGADWIFELFSPPLIQCRAGTTEFIAGLMPRAAATEAEQGIKLLAIRPVPYRVQFQGGFEIAGEYVAALVATETRAVWCGRPGERWATMDVVLENVEGVAVAREDPNFGAAHLARAGVRDEKTGRPVMLVSGVPTMTHELRATVRLAGSSKPQNLREGDVCGDGENAYRVDRLSLDPVAVAVVTKVEPNGQAGETMLLQPEKSHAADPRKVTRAESSSYPQLFHNGP